MAGGPSQLDLFDPKPALVKYEGQQVPDEVLERGRTCRLSSAMLLSWRLRLNSHTTANRARRFRNCSLILPELWTTWHSCDRYTPTHSIMLRHNFC